MKQINLFVGSILKAFFVILFAAGWTLGLAQVSGAISGNVTDQTGARVPGVKVTLHHVETGRVRTVLTDEMGRYDAPALAVGSYEVSAEIAGFHNTVRKGITLTVGSHEVVDISMQVGAVAETVEVTAETPLVNTSSAAVSEVVDEKKVRDLPLNGRDISQLLLLQSDVSQARGKSKKLLTSNGNAFNISGQRDTANVFLVDGTDITDLRGSASSAGGPLSGVETIREFRVLTGGYSAEYGKAMGGVVTAVTKSGTNQFHGSAFEFHRNDNLDARNFFDQAAPPEFKRNQFGGTLGGPIVKDKTFFFGSYEGTRERLGMTIIKTVPSAAARQGIIRGQQLALDPRVKPYLDLYPAANGKDFGNDTAENITPYSQPTNEDFFTVRVDHAFSANNMFFARHTFSDSKKNVVGSSAFVIFPEADTARNQFLTLQDTHVFSSKLLNTFRFGISRTTPIQGAANTDKYPALDFIPGQGFGSIALGGFDSNLGSDNSLPRTMIQNIIDYADNVGLALGSHSVKFGFQIQRYQQNTTFGDRLRGQYDFPTVQDLVLGRPSRFQGALPGATQNRSFRFTTYGLFVQDDVRVSSTLSLNLGMRYEFTTVPTETHGRLSALRDLYGPTYTVGPPFQNPGLLNFSPRLGISWDPTGSGKMSIRAGGGILYQPITTQSASSFASASTSMPPFSATADIRGTTAVPLAIFPNGLQLMTQPDIRIVLAPRGLDWKTAQPKVYRFNADIQRELASNFAVDIGYSGAMARDLMKLDIFNTRIPRIVNGRIMFTPSDRLRNPNFGEIRYFHPSDSASYHSMRVSATKRYSHGLQMQFSYTLAKSIDLASSISGGDFSGDRSYGRSVDFPRIDKALSTFDSRHNFNFNYSYDIPLGRGRSVPLSGMAETLLGGWQLSGIVTLGTGNPVTPEVNRTLDWDGDGNTQSGGLADLRPGQSPRTLGSPDRWYDPSVFAMPPQNAFGNAGRNTIIGPGLANVDFGLIKETAIPSVSESFSLQFRAEFFNIFNHTNFGQPDSIVFLDRSGSPAGAAGRINSTNTSSRQIQFGMKIQF